MSPKRQFILGAILGACLFYGCAHTDPYVATGEGLHVVGQEFVMVGGAMNRALDEHTITMEQYAEWAKFAVKFKVSYSLAIKAWKVAVQEQDAVKQGQVQKVIMDLSSELAEFTPLVVQLIHPEGTNGPH